MAATRVQDAPFDLEAWAWEDMPGEEVGYALHAPGYLRIRIVPIRFLDGKDAGPAALVLHDLGSEEDGRDATNYVLAHGTRAECRTVLWDIVGLADMIRDVRLQVTEEERDYLLAILECDEGENAPDGVDADDLANRLAIACPER